MRGEELYLCISFDNKMLSLHTTPVPGSLPFLDPVTPYSCLSSSIHMCGLQDHGPQLAHVWVCPIPISSCHTGLLWLVTGSIQLPSHLDFQFSSALALHLFSSRQFYSLWPLCIASNQIQRDCERRKKTIKLIEGISLVSLWGGGVKLFSSHCSLL